MIELFSKIKSWFENNSNNTSSEVKDKEETPKITKAQTRKKVIELIEKAEQLTPKKKEKDLPNMKNYPDVREHHFYEDEIWRIGEEIRQLIFEHKGLRKDEILNDRIINFCLNRNSKSGRQSFIMLLWYKHNQKYAEKLVSLIDDKYVYGHVIEGLNKLQIEGYCEQVYPFVNDERKWIKKQAKKYIDKYCTQQTIHKTDDR